MTRRAGTRKQRTDRAAGRGGPFARAREELARNAQRQSEHEQRQLQARFEGERDVAGARLMVVERPEWWDPADTRQIAGMHETAQQWRQFNPRARAAADTIAREVKDRYGVDVDNLGADPQAFRAALAQVELDRDQAVRGERGTAATDYTQAALAVQEADHLGLMRPRASSRKRESTNFSRPREGPRSRARRS